MSVPGEEASAAALAPLAPPREPYNAGEEAVHVLTHGLGLAFSLVGFGILVSAGLRSDARNLACAVVYGATLIVLYASSTLYHCLREPRLRRLAQTLDHSSIYLLIAGTYTPFTLVTLRGGWGWAIFGVVWGLAAFGLAAEAWWEGRPTRTSLGLYLAMGWVMVVALKPLIERLPTGGLTLLVAGGLSYTGGTVFYGLKRVRYTHAVWHVFVLLGSACHFLAVARYVITSP